MSTNHTPTFFAFAAGPLDWREAVAAACRPLAEAGVDAAALAGAITASVDRYGPYFILEPGVAVVYAEDEFISPALEAMGGLAGAGNGSIGGTAFPCLYTAGKGEHQLKGQTDSAGGTALSCLRTGQAVSFDPNDSACTADILVVPAAREKEVLLDMVKRLARALRGDGLVERLRGVTEGEAAKLLSDRLSENRR